MSALSTPSGGGTTAQNKPAAGKQKYQKLDINSLYCTNRNENSEPSSVKSQLSRKHGMQSLGKVPSTRRPPANLPSLKTETGQDPNANSISTTSTSVSSPPTCTSQTLPTSTASGAGAGAAGGWVSLPPPTSPHFRTEFPSLEAAAQPDRRPDHSAPQLRPQTEGSWTCGGGSSARAEAGSPVPAPAQGHVPAYRAILPPFLVKGSTGGAGGAAPLALGGLGALRDGPRRPPRAPPTPRAVEVLTARPILRDEQISSLDNIGRDAGWAQHDDIDYDQKLDFSDGESSAPNKGSRNNRASIESDRDTKHHEPVDEDQMWAERRQKQNNEVAQAIARARQRKEEEQRRQMSSSQSKDFRDKPERDRNDNRDSDARDKDRLEPRDRIERQDIREKDRSEPRDRDVRDKERENRDRERPDRDRFDNRDRDRDIRERDRDKMESRDRGRDTRDRQERPEEKERMDVRDRERNDNRDRNDARDRNDNRERNDARDRNDTRDRTDTRDRNDARDRNDTRDRTDTRDRNDNRERVENRDRNENRDRFDRSDRDRNDRDRSERERNERDRDFRDRDSRDFNRDRDQNNPAFSKSFQQNIPPRFLKQQQNRQDNRQDSRQEEPPHKGWAFSGKPAPRRPEPAYSAPRHPPHNARRSYSRDYSDREDDFRREKEGSGPQWRSEMQDYERSGRDLDRSNSKESYKDFDYKGKESETRKSMESSEQSGRSAAEKLSEVFERKSIGIIEPFASSDSSQTDRRSTPPSRRESSEKECTKSTSWAEVTEELNVNKSASDKATAAKEVKPLNQEEEKRIVQTATVPPLVATPQVNTVSNASVQNQKFNTLTPVQPTVSAIQNAHINTHTSNVPSVQTQVVAPVSQQPVLETHNPPKVTSPLVGVAETFASHMQKQSSSDKLPQSFAKALYPKDKEVPETNQTPKQEAPVTKPPETTPEVVEVKRSDDKHNETNNAQQGNRGANKEPVERKSSGSGSEKKGRGFGGGYAVYNRGWGGREGRGRRSHRSSRSEPRASESDASTDGTGERRERRKTEQEPPPVDGLEPREPFAPRGQPSRRGRGGFQGVNRPPAPAKRLAGYGPPNTRSPFGQANRAREDDKEERQDDKPRVAGGSAPRGRDRRPKQAQNAEDENWETTSEHSEGGGPRRRSGANRQGQSKGQGGRNQNPKSSNNARTGQGAKKEGEVNATEAADGKGPKRDEELGDDGFQQVRNKKKETRPSKEEAVSGKRQPRSHSKQGGQRNGSSSRNGSGSAPRNPSKGAGYERGRQASLAPRFVKQRQKQAALAQDVPAPPPPPHNAWDKPLRATADEPSEPAPEPAAEPEAGLLDGTTPPVETIIFENTNYKCAPGEETPATQEPAQPYVERRRCVDLVEPEAAPALPLQMFDAPAKAEESDMKLDFAFDSDLGQLEEKGKPRLGTTISPLAADLNLKIASVKKVWEMPAVAEGGEELPFGTFEEGEAPPNVCKVKPTQQLQSPPPQLYAPYPAGYGGLSVPSPPVLYNNTQQAPLYQAFLDQGRAPFGGFPAPYNYQPPPDMFQSLPNQYRMAATAGGGAAFGQSGQLANSPSTVLISSTSNSLMSATVKPTQQQIGAIGSKGGGYGQQYVGYSAPAEAAAYGLVPRAPSSSYYSPYQPPAAPQPSYPLQYSQPQQSSFSSQFLSSQLQVAAAVQQMQQQQYRAPMQQQYQTRPQTLKSPLEHNGFPLAESASPTPKGGKVAKPPHSPPHHKYHAPPPHMQHQVQQQVQHQVNNNGRMQARPLPPRYPAPIQRPLAPAPQYRAPPRAQPPARPHQPYYHPPQRNGGERAADGAGGDGDEPADPQRPAE